MPLSRRLECLPLRALPGGVRIFEAVTLRSRLLGLAALAPRAPGVALHLPRTRSVHTLGMRFLLDLVWLDANGGVVRVDRDVPPRRLRACRRARSVVEVTGGDAERLLDALEGQTR